MVEKVNSRIQQYNYNTINSVRNTVNTSTVNQSAATQPSFTASSNAKTPQTNNNVAIRTSLSGKEEKAKCQGFAWSGIYLHCPYCFCALGFVTVFTRFPYLL